MLRRALPLRPRAPSLLARAPPSATFYFLATVLAVVVLQVIIFELQRLEWLAVTSDCAICKAEEEEGCG